MKGDRLPRIAILISGRGSNMESIVKACASGEIKARVCCVISNKPTAAGLAFAKANDIESIAIDHREFHSRAAFDQHLATELDTFKPNFVVLAGFMRILSPNFIQHFANCIINIHPSLLPEYPGLHTHERALAAGDRQAGASVHFVTPELDSGPIIIQAQVDVEPDDAADSLAARVLVAEHIIYPIALSWLVNGDITTDGKQCYYRGSVMVKPASWYNGQLHNPETYV